MHDEIVRLTSFELRRQDGYSVFLSWIPSIPFPRAGDILTVNTDKGTFSYEVIRVQFTHRETSFPNDQKQVSINLVVLVRMAYL